MSSYNFIPDQQVEIKNLDESVKSHDSQIKYSNFFKNSINNSEDNQYQQNNLNLVKEINIVGENPNVSRLNTQSTSNKKIFPNFELRWKDLEVTSKIYNKKTKKKTEKTILDKVSGNVKSGECLAIIGSSGAGKTTLMNCLSRKIRTKNLKLKGEILLNDKEVDTKVMNRISCYVMQDDVLEATMTPLEILMFTAKLKLNLPKIEIEQRVLKMLQNLHLTYCMNTRVGSTLKRGVSGGERKRTSIGVELISDPKIIFLDEPTTGLDSYNAYEVILLLRKLSKEGKIVIFTIHQPSSEIFYLLDKIGILAVGKNIYFGPQSKCYECFQIFNLPVPSNYNPFEHFIEMTNVTSVVNDKVLDIYFSLKEIENKDERYLAYAKILNLIYEENKQKFLGEESCLNESINKNNQVNADNLNTNNGKSSTNAVNNYDDDVINNHIRNRKKYCYELSILVGRSTLINLRNRKILILRVIQNLFVALFMAALYYDLSKEYSGIQDRRGIIILSVITNVFGAITTTLLSFPEEKKVFLRERANKLYRVSTYVLARSIVEIPLFFISNSLFAIAVYWTAFMNDTFSYKYYTYLGILILSTLVGSGFSLALSSLISNQALLINVNTAISIPLLLISGFFANAENFAPYLIPFEYISVYKYSFQSLVHNEFTDIQPFYCYNSGNMLCYQFIVQKAFREPFYISLIGIGCLYILFKVTAFIFIFFFNKIKV